MKIRQGFVSNSSSSSYIAVTYSGDELLKIWKKLGFKKNWDYSILHQLQDADHDRYFIGDSDLILFYNGGADYSFIGIDIVYHLEQDNWTIAHAKAKLHSIIKKEFQIDVPLKEIGFSYGEWGSG